MTTTRQLCALAHPSGVAALTHHCPHIPRLFDTSKQTNKQTGLSHGYAGRGQLFRDVNLEIEQGERVAIIGPNGAGKSTLLRLIMGKEQANKGRVSERE